MVARPSPIHPSNCLLKLINPFDMFKNYLKTTIRNLWKNKTYSFLNIFGLAVGVACAGLIFLWVEYELSYDQNYPKRGQLYSVLENQAYDGKTYTFGSTPGLMGPVMKKEIPGIANACRTTWDQTSLFSLGEKSIFQQGNLVDSSFFSMFSLRFVQGNAAHAFDQLHSLVITEKMAAKFFGTDSHILGKTIKVDNKDEYAVTGVVKGLPENSSMQFDWLAPFDIYLAGNDWLNNWGNNGIRTYVELSPSANLSSVNKQLYGFIQKRSSDAVARPFLFSMNDWRLRSNFVEGKQVGGRIDFVRMFTIIAWIVLLIACINFMNLATARSEKRAREVGVRKVLGAGRSTLIRQFIGEALFLSLLSVLLAILIISWTLPAFNLLIEKHLSIEIGKPVHLIALTSIVLICGLIAGSYPALYLSSFNPIFVFKGLKMKGGSAAWIRKGLVIFQFCISIVLIISTIIIYQQVQYVKNRELGYDKDNLVVMDVQGNMEKHFDPIKQDLINTGFVENVAMSQLDMLWMGSNSSDYKWQGKDPNSKILVTGDGVSPEYISTTKTRIIQGRDFRSLSDSTNIIINETLAALMKKENPIGEIISQDTSKYTVIGVVKNFVYGDMYGKADPLIFFCSASSSHMYVRLKPNKDPEKAIAKIETVMKRNNPGYPFDYHFVDTQFNGMFRTEMLIGKLSRVFASLAIFISCLGLFGLAAYTAERRTREIGIRKVLGASITGITSLLSKDFLILVGIAALIAFPIAWFAMDKWLQDYAYRISISWWVFVLAGSAAMLIALITVSFQAIKVALNNPVRSLRTE
jgi:putative ABC transport system permease protein